MNEILGAIGFFQAIRNQMRFGEFSRLPIRLERFAIRADTAECDWFMRPPDPWDVPLPASQRERHLTQQALQDGLKIRELIFRGSRRSSAPSCKSFASANPGLRTRSTNWS